MEMNIFYNEKGILNKNKIQEKWIKNNLEELYLNVLRFIHDNKLKTEKFSQSLYHYYNDMKSLPLCKFCGKINNRFVGFDSGYRDCCSKHCEILYTRPKGIETRKKNTIEKYGVEHTSQLDSVKEKQKQTNLIRYNGVAPSCNKEILNKVIKTNNEKYGCDYPLQNPNIVKKSGKIVKEIVNKQEYIENKKKTSNEKYGCDYPISSEIVKDKIEKTNIERYGHRCSLLNDIIKEKSKKTLMNIYGVEHPMKSSVIVKKLIETKSESAKKHIIEQYPELDILDVKNHTVTINCEECQNTYNISISLLYLRNREGIKKCLNCNPYHTSQSKYEHKLIDWLKEINIKFDEKRRDLISPLELDLYLPEYNIAFEINGLYWHSELQKDKDYHLNKTKMCLENNIHLIHLWQDQVELKFDIIKSRILNLLNKNNNRIFARKCSIKIINDGNIIRSFLTDNHLQGSINSNINIGLYYNDELVSLMTFGKRRIALGSKNSEGFELLRFCNKNNINVVGGASRLFKFFIDNWKPKQIVSYANMDWSLEGDNLYDKLGFNFVGYTTPNYWWTDGIQRHYRFNFRKDKLIKEGYDPTKTENEIMHDRGYYKIWDTGNLKFKYKKVNA
jgi:very-short-patch-repair endonuclease